MVKFLDNVNSYGVFTYLHECCTEEAQNWSFILFILIVWSAVQKVVSWNKETLLLINYDEQTFSHQTKISSQFSTAKCFVKSQDAQNIVMSLWCNPVSSHCLHVA